jgi:hypothetical protein
LALKCAVTLSKFVLSNRVKLKSNTQRFKKAFFRVVALITLISFSAQQVIFAQEAVQNHEGQYVPVITPEKYAEKQQAEVKTPESFSDVKPDNPLTVSEENYEARQTVDEVSDLLREDFAYAAVLKNLSESDMRTLLDADVEVGLIVVDGEIVLFTSGSADEIRTAPAAQDLFERASLIAHTHPRAEQSTGPSGKDIDMATGEEYVITEAGVYVYDSMGVKGKITFEEFVERIRSSDFNRWFSSD